jgi:hypothetical protein
MKYLLNACFVLVAGAGVAHPSPVNARTSLINSSQRLFAEPGWRSFPPSVDDGKICLVRKDNGSRECKTRASWEKVAARLSAKGR